MEILIFLVVMITKNQCIDNYCVYLKVDYVEYK